MLSFSHFYKDMSLLASYKEDKSLFGSVSLIFILIILKTNYKSYNFYRKISLKVAGNNRFSIYNILLNTMQM